MVQFLSETETQKIKECNEKLKPFAEKGWMTEGSDAMDNSILVCFNNDTDEYVFVHRNGSIISSELNVTSMKEAKQMAALEVKKYRICYGGGYR